MAWPYITKAWFPCADVPMNLYDAHVLNRCVAGDPFYLNYYYVNIRPVPRLLFQVYAACVLPLAGPVFTVKLFLLVYFISLPLAVVWLARAAGQSGVLAGLMSIPLAANMCLNAGFLDFCAGLPLSIVVIAYWMRNKDHLTASRTMLFAALLVLVFFAHLFCIAATLCAIIVISLSGGLPRRAAKQCIIAWIPCVILLLWYFVGARLQRADSDLTLKSAFYFDHIRWVVKDLVYGGTLAQLGGATINLAKIYMLLLIAAVFFAAVFKRHTALDVGSFQLSVIRRDAFLLLFIVFLALYCVLPGTWGPSSRINQRALIYVLVFASIWSDSLVFAKVRFVLCLAAAALLIPYAIGVANIGERVNRAATDYTKGIPFVAAHATITALATDELFPSGRDGLGHAVALYALERNGIYLGDINLGYGGVRFRTERNGIPESHLWPGSPTGDGSYSVDLIRDATKIDYAVSWTDSTDGEPPGVRAKYNEVFETRKLKVFERADRIRTPRLDK
jgi:hypothetical protein